MPDCLKRWEDQAYADTYIRFTSPVEFEAAQWVGKLGLTSDSTLVDLGCGEGKLLAELANHIKAGVGVDGSIHMVESSRRLLLKRGISNVRIVHGDFREFDSGEEIADAVVSIAALHHVPDKDKRHILDQVYSMLKSRGGFYLEDDSFNFTREEMNERIPEIYAQWEKRFGIENWQILKSELAGDDFEFTSFLDDISHMVKKSGLELSTLDPSVVSQKFLQ